jgi:hypothetical protein
MNTSKIEISSIGKTIMTFMLIVGFLVLRDSPTFMIVHDSIVYNSFFSKFLRVKWHVSHNYT